ncbi:hypothetical protein L249_2136 [Ophiocordyceps polyrhachis-furcata BCC 54312]|uniref:Uncharacterized protein n=1 Tax=Ophiocordyceps polyrhachis-furcata BCC 54312 TaxID=1330021 RepID=A0A367LNY3_9HYPO|nr:hypothetical protein L249_2136 [Ophiocordyceps polyrhachis-furcata BCC 54312]
MFGFCLALLARRLLRRDDVIVKQLLFLEDQPWMNMAKSTDRGSCWRDLRLIARDRLSRLRSFKGGKTGGEERKRKMDGAILHST